MHTATLSHVRSSSRTGEFTRPRRTDLNRRCLSLAMEVTGDVDAYLVPNEQVQWKAMFDVPACVYPNLNRFDAESFTNVAQAHTHYGMPSIDFAIDKKSDAGWCPYRFVLDAGDPVHNQMHTSMHAFANAAKFDDGEPVCPWLYHQKRNLLKDYRNLPPEAWMPRALLAYGPDKFKRLYTLATQREHVGETYFICEHCNREIRSQHFNNTHPDRLSNRVMQHEDGEFTATCPACRHRHVWHASKMLCDDVVEHFTPVFKTRFYESLCAGLPVHADRECTYIGPTVINRQASGLCAHQLQCADGQTYEVFLPANAQINVQRGTPLLHGQVWAHAAPQVRGVLRPVAHITQAYWNAIGVMYCLSGSLLSYLRQLWFHNQAMVNPHDSTQMLVPAELLSLVNNRVQPDGLWWNLADNVDYEATGDKLRTYVFPPLPVTRREELQQELPGNVRLNAPLT